MVATGSVSDLLRAVSRYLRLNPLASDTVEGIRMWWLTGTPAATTDLEQALHQLARAGVVEATRAADGQVHYRRAAVDAAVDAKLDRIIAGDPL